MKFKLIGWGVTALIVGTITFGVYATFMAHRARTDAEILVAQLHQLRVGESSFNEVKTIADAHHRYLVPDTSTCANDVCYFDFLYENLPLARLGLSSQTGFGVRVQTYQGRVDVIALDLSCGTRPNYFGIWVMEATQIQALEPSSFQISNVRGEITWVRMTRSVSQVQRDQAYSLSLKCLDHFGRCRSKAELLPVLADEVVAH